MRQTRRTFLKRAGLGTTGATALAWAAPVIAAQPADQVAVGVIGLSRGRSVAQALAGHGAHIKYVCDVDQGRREVVRKAFQAEKAVADMREIFDDKSVDAVVVATPDHWHVPASLLALNAGKHVYVEKPCSHNIREGRLLVEAAGRTKLAVQVGTQSRSTEFIRRGIKLLREGAIGRVLVAKAWNSQRRANIGHAEPSAPPAGFDYDLWVGPAPMRPFRKTCHHYTWHWWYDFGTGDAGNDGVHELDIARWGLGDPDHPTAVCGHGSKLYFDDDQQFPDTLYTTFEYPGAGKLGQRRLLVYEQRIWAPYQQEALENGNAFYGTEGMLILGKGSGWKLYGPRNKLLKEERGTFDASAHAADFLEAIRSGRKTNAEAEIGHRSAALAHLANTLARTGRGSLEFDPDGEQFVNDTEAAPLVTRKYRQGHWAVPKGV